MSGKSIQLYRSGSIWFLNLFIVALFALQVSCGGGSGDTGTPTSSSNSATFSSELSGQEVVPAVDSALTASANFTVNTTTGGLSGSVTVSDASNITAAHIHAGALGQNGAILVTLETDPANPAVLRVPAGTVLNSADLSSIQNETTYVQLHSSRFPTGELRGQILKSNTEFVRLTVDLNGVQNVPAVITPGTGRAVVLLNRTSGEVGGGLILSSLTGTAVAGHIHIATPGKNGAIAVTLVQDPANANAFNIPAGTQLDTINLASVLNEESYLAIHTDVYTTGEVRGQILTRSTSRIVTAVLDGRNVVPAVNSTGKASAVLLVDTASRAISGTMTVTQLSSNYTVSHLHDGAVGLNGPITFAFEADGVQANQYNVPAGTVLTPEVLTSLLNDATYLQIHTDVVTTGELRGQLLANADSVVLNSILDGASVVPPVTSTGVASGGLLVNQLTGELSGALTLSNLNNTVIAAHIHVGDTTQNGPIIVTLQVDPLNTNVYRVPSATDLSSTDLASLLNGNTYFQIHTDVNTTGELRGQILPALN